jgi:hypothetical protein
MTAFFDPPPEPERAPEPAPRYRMPPWLGPPGGTLPGVVPVELVLARTERVAVCVGRIGAYPTGFELVLQTIAAELDEELDPLLFGPPSRRGGAPQDQMLRFGLQFADGSKVTNTGAFHARRGQPPGPVLNDHGGGGGGGGWDASQWVWPLPPPGPVAFVCEWPVAGIPESRAEIDAQVILDAASRAQVIFSDDDLPLWPDDDDEDDGPEVVRIR